MFAARSCPIGLAFLAGGLLLAGSPAAGEPVDYLRQVKPILKQRCYACHGAMKQKAGLRLDTGTAIRRGGDSGPAIEPGHAEESLLLERVTESDPTMRMPPEGAPLTSEQIALLRAWIVQGAPAPAGETPEPDPRRHWAFQPPVRSDVPALPPRQAGWARNPIDAFLAQAYLKHGLAPAPPAEPDVLLRRVYLDLIGLPPTRAELQEFRADPSEAAYGRVVDRLLASPQYGERWARHWMDVWRYSDWYGRRAVPDVLNSYARIWRWRDWIVRSLNEDKPYDRMVAEMLAADELAPTDDANLVATGFLVRNWFRWNYNSWMKDNVEHVGKAFLGLTINCAHCHDHKYDPITQEDYFAFRACFEPLELRHDRVPGEPDPGPYPKYEYGKAYAPITSGMVRVFDEKLDAKTFLYTRGESRNVVPGRPPIAPSAPAFLKGRAFHIEPIDLPPEAYYPGLKAFVRREELAHRESEVVGTERAADRSSDWLATAERAAVEAEIRQFPDNPRAFVGMDTVLAFTTKALPSSELSQARSRVEAARFAWAVDQARSRAARAELAALRARIAADDARYGRGAGDVATLARDAARAHRQAAVARSATALAQAEQAVFSARGKAPTAITKAQQQLAAARKAHEAALKAQDNASTDYPPLSPVYPARSTGRRAALARWITDRSNPLTARVAVNHIWRWHLGTPIVATTHDFGRNGQPPTFPELLDWLAVELMEPTTTAARPWSMKALHRLIVTSAAYRMASRVADPAHPGRLIDPDNRWSWRFARARLEAEVLRDSLLHVAGALDPAIGGPDLDYAQGLSSHRRSLYFTHHGEAKMPFLELFDAADACDCYRRSTSVVPQQALALVNNEMTRALAHRLAERLWDELGSPATAGSPCDTAFITAAFEQVLAREPSPAETALAREFLVRQARLLGPAPEVHAPSHSHADASDPRARARVDLIHALFSHNDFLTVH
ncbi:MAG TPA: PSD1 and planctomycete cytochrome C domain-containing protein [Isosphaeraceae bacterium]|nr:PSD1 and planctomycete cytochrome C domain-containing protein [Isosphaeraceae bacterium]